MARHVRVLVAQQVSRLLGVLAAHRGAVAQRVEVRQGELAALHLPRDEAGAVVDDHVTVLVVLEQLGERRRPIRLARPLLRPEHVALRDRPPRPRREYERTRTRVPTLSSCGGTGTSTQSSSNRDHRRHQRHAEPRATRIHGWISAVPPLATPTGTATSAATIIPRAGPLPSVVCRPSAAPIRCTGPRTFLRRGEHNADEVEIVASLHQQDHAVRREHGPERVQPSPRAGQGDRQRPGGTRSSPRSPAAAGPAPSRNRGSSARESHRSRARPSTCDDSCAATGATAASAPPPRRTVATRPSRGCPPRRTAARPAPSGPER